MMKKHKPTMVDAVHRILTVFTDHERVRYGPGKDDFHCFNLGVEKCSCGSVRRGADYS